MVEIDLFCFLFIANFVDLFLLDFSRYESNPRYSGVTSNATHAKCSPRVAVLATPVQRHANYQYELPVPRPIARAALKYQASTRMTELAEPKKLPRT